ncbi:MAG: hypothetical protein SF052_05860 [Bacteroidia bacterium]|nr:hypothetical protein [Bacteroidia bacterium]
MDNVLRALLLLLCIFVFACTSHPELQNVPVFAGVTIDQNCGSSVVIDNLDTYKEFKLKSWLIEFPFTLSARHTGSDFRYYEIHTIDTLVNVFKAEQTPYILSFPLENPQNYPLKNARITHYLTDVSGILLRTNEYPPSAVVFSGIWMDPAFHGEDLKRFIAELKTSFEVFSGDIIFAGFPHELMGDFDWESPDVIGIRYHEPTDDNLDVYYAELNSQIAAHLIDCQKPAMIIHSNLFGDRKLDLFRRQLSFWPDSVEIKGIALNSLHCEMSLSGTNSFFSLSEDHAFQAFLKDYLN